MSQPYVRFNDIVGIGLGQVRIFPATSGALQFSVRELELRDTEGATFRIQLFGVTAEDLRVTVDASVLVCQAPVSEPLPVCANDGKRDPKPDSGDDPRWQGPEYDKYEADERRGA